MKMKTIEAAPLVLATALAALLLAACPPPDKPEKPVAPEAPGNLSAIAQSSSSIQVVWSDNSDNEDSFLLEYDTVADFSGKVEIILPTDTTDKLVEGLDASTKHYFRVKAVNDVGASTYSNVGEATTQDPPQQAPTAPSDLAATAASSTAILTSWKDNSDNEDNFVIAYSKTADFAANTEETLLANTALYLVGSLDPNTKYFLRVKATNSAGSSAWSNTAEATTPILIEGTMVINGGEAYTNNRVVIINSNVTGAAQMRFQNAGEGWQPWSPYDALVNWTITTPGDGTKTVYGEFKDAFGTVLSKSDSIILDTVPPVQVSPFLINSGAAYTKSTNVTLTYAYNGASKMRFKNQSQLSYPDWEDYAASRAWTIPSSQGSQTVEAQFADAAGNYTETSDSIILDTIAPSGYFWISIGTWTSHAWTPSATLNMSVSGASKMRFSNQSGVWPPSWETYTASKPWTIASGEGSNSYVYGQFQDDAGNLLEYNDFILYDAIRSLRFTAEQIHIENDAETIGPGEILWNFGGNDTSGDAFTIYNTDESTVELIESNNTYDFGDVSVIISMDNVPGESYRLVFRIAEDDWFEVGGLVWSDEATVTYYYGEGSSGWGIGTGKSIYAGGTPSGTMYFKIELVD